MRKKVFLLLVVSLFFYCGLYGQKQGPRKGGRIISAILGDPPTFNPLASNHSDLQTLNQLVNPGLIRLNLVTHQLEPSLAIHWESQDDGLTWRFQLRQNIRWSDGHPFTAEDVLFTMQIINDPNIDTPARDSLAIDGKAIQWKKIDDHTITARLPAAFAPFLRKLDGAAVPILPRHKWQLLYKQGKFNEAMPVTMNMTEFVGLGPFLPRQYHAGQSLTLFRNPLYWKKDRHGAQLPYLDEITFLIVPDLNQLQLKIENGEIDTFQSIRPEDVERLKDPSSVNRASLLNLGASYDLEGLFFNQNAETNPATGKHYLDPTKRRWFTNRNFRKAISFAIDRDTLVKNIFFGMAVPATGVESPGNKLWFNPQVTLYPHDLKKALALLRDEGFVRQQEPSGRLKLLDKNGNEVRFALHTNAGNNLRNAQCIAIKSDLAKLGIAVEYSALDFNSLIAKITQTY
ncbi:MAG TPA: ABC transporter substrate-binding protein, partial [Acidobacteriota bacterium]